jgi:hypothetical protein
MLEHIIIYGRWFRYYRNQGYPIDFSSQFAVIRLEKVFGYRYEHIVLTGVLEYHDRYEVT